MFDSDSRFGRINTTYLTDQDVSESAAGQPVSIRLGDRLRTPETGDMGSNLVH